MKKMKKIAILLAAFPFYASAQTSLPYSTGFDSPADLEGWSFQENGNVCGPAHSNHYWDSRELAHAISGTNVLHHDYEVGYEGTDLTEDWAFSPNFNFETGATLSFKINVYAIAGIRPEDNIKVYLVKSDGAGSIVDTTLLCSLRDLCDNIHDAYVDTSIIIPPTEGNFSHIAFKYESVNNWFTVAIDDLMIEANTTSISDVIDFSTDVSLFPNPAKDKITLSYDGNKIDFESIYIRDMSGRIVKILPFSTVIDISDLPNNNYMVELHSEKGIAIKRLTVQK